MNNDITKIKIVMAYTQRWTNIGLSFSFLCIAIFLFIFINTDLPIWWSDLSASSIISILLDVLLFIPIGFLLLLCLVANDHYESIKSKIIVLVASSFLMSIFLAFIVCTILNNEMNSIYSIGIFLFYTTFILFALFTLNVINMPIMNISQGLFVLPFVNTFFSLPFVFIVWKMTGVIWISLIPLLTFIFYFLYNAKTSFTWVTINKFYFGNYTYKVDIENIATYDMIGGIFGDKLYKFDIVDINMFKIDNYKSLGLYMTIYNFLPNIGIVLNNNTEILESVTDVLEKENDKKNPLHFYIRRT